MVGLLGPSIEFRKEKSKSGKACYLFNSESCTVMFYGEFFVFKNKITKGSVVIGSEDCPIDESAAYDYYRLTQFAPTVYLPEKEFSRLLMFLERGMVGDFNLPSYENFFSPLKSEIKDYCEAISDSKFASIPKGVKRH